jgi:hypothetical protein
MVIAADNEAAIQPLVKKIWAAFDEAKAKRTPISVEGATNKTAWTTLAGKPKMRYCQYLVRDGSRKRGANDDTHSVRVTVNLDRATHAIIGGERYPIVKSALHRGVIHVSVGESETFKPVKKEGAKPVKQEKHGGNGSKKTHFVRDGYLACHPRADVSKFATTTDENKVTCKTCKEDVASQADTEKWIAEIDALQAEWTKDGNKWKHADGRTIERTGHRFLTFDKDGLTIDGGTKGEQPKHLLEAMRKQPKLESKKEDNSEYKAKHARKDVRNWLRRSRNKDNYSVQDALDATLGLSSLVYVTGKDGESYDERADIHVMTDGSALVSHGMGERLETYRHVENAVADLGNQGYEKFIDEDAEDTDVAEVLEDCPAEPETTEEQQGERQ